MSQTVAKPFRRNKALATGMLVAMGAMFLATFLVPEPTTWVLFLRAVAEAGMIGGLADWFAVEALFRHPLRIPIPHTALLPKSKNRVATNIGDFITEHFLKPDLIRQKLLDLNAAAALSGWLLSPGNAGLISQKTSLVLKSSLLETGASEPPVFFKSMLRNLLMRPKREIFISQMIGKLMASELRGAMTDFALRSVRDLLDDNRETFTNVVQERSRWWIASTADRRLSKMLIDEMIGLIDDLLIRDSSWRQKLDEALTGFATDPKQSMTLSKTIQTLLLNLIESEEFDEIVATFIRGLKRSLDEDLAGEGGQTIAFIESTLLSVAHKLEASPADMEALNEGLSSAAGELVERLSSTASSFIATTIQNWDEHTLITLIEEQVGSDLQFIRMNGTLLGGFIGGALFFLSEFFLQFV